jgi:hypothetical protein
VLVEGPVGCCLINTPISIAKSDANQGAAVTEVAAAVGVSRVSVHGWLEDAVVVMQERQATLRGVTRLYEPPSAEPLIVIFVDELAALSYVNERELRRRIDNALGLLLSQGRAVGVSIIGAIRDPRKDVLPRVICFRSGWGCG